MSIENWALKYRKRGWSVIPIHSVFNGHCTCGMAHRNNNSAGKHPVIYWEKYAKTKASLNEIRDWYESEYIDSNVGIVTGKISNLVIVDVDGIAGVKALQKLGLHVPGKTLCSRTGGGGYHLFYRYPVNETVRGKLLLLEKVDIKGDNGYIVLPPSKHKSGNRYKWLNDPFDTPILPLPRVLIELIKKRKEVEKEDGGKLYADRLIDGVGEGERAHSASRLAGRYLNLGMTKHEVVVVLTDWNARNSPPLPERELMNTINWAVRKNGAGDEADEHLAKSVKNMVKGGFTRRERQNEASR